MCGLQSGSDGEDELVGSSPADDLHRGGKAVAPHYHVGHPRKKTQSMTKGTGPYDGDNLYANTGVPANPPGTPNPPLARRDVVWQSSCSWWSGGPKGDQNHAIHAFRDVLCMI